VSAAEFADAAWRLFPFTFLHTDFGAAGAHPSTATQVFDVRGTLSIPVFQGGSVHGAVLQADARLAESRERMQSRGQIDAEVARAAHLQSSAEQVEVARSNIDLAEAH